MAIFNVDDPLPSLYGRYSRFLTNAEQSALSGASVLSASRLSPLVPPRFTLAQVEASTAPLRQHIAELEAQLLKLVTDAKGT